MSTQSDVSPVISARSMASSLSPITSSDRSFCGAPILSSDKFGLDEHCSVSRRVFPDRSRDRRAFHSTYRCRSCLFLLRSSFVRELLPRSRSRRRAFPLTSILLSELPVKDTNSRYGHSEIFTSFSEFSYTHKEVRTGFPDKSRLVRLPRLPTLRLARQFRFSMPAREVIPSASSPRSRYVTSAVFRIPSASPS